MCYTYNSDPNYYKNNSGNANCGSFAFQIKEWYHPEDDFIDEVGEIEYWIEDMIDEGYTEDELTDIYLWNIVDSVLKDFDDIEICDGSIPDTNEQELIALSVFCEWNEDFEFADNDFHFKVFRDGRWMHKPGMYPVEFCELEDWGRYTSKVIYFYHRIKNSER